MELTDAQIIGAIATLVAMLPGVAALLLSQARNRADTHKASADAASVISDTALTLLPVLRQRVADLDIEVANLRMAQDKQLAVTKALECQVEEMRVTIALLVKERNGALEKLRLEQP